MFIRKTSITLLPISTMIATLAVVMNEGNLSHPIPTAKAWIVNNVQIISDDGADEMILKQFNDLHSAIKKRKSNKNNKESSIVVNCYLKWDDHIEQKSYLEKMHNEIINMPLEETLKSLHKFGYLGYLREEVYDEESCVIRHLFSEAWSEGEENNNDSSKKDRYCKIVSDVLKARLPKAIKITMQREEKLEDNESKNKNTITRRTTGRQRQEKEDYNPRVASLKDFVQLFEQKEKEGKNPRVYVSY
jgi:hypothetical protein